MNRCVCEKCRFCYGEEIENVEIDTTPVKKKFGFVMFPQMSPLQLKGTGTFRKVYWCYADIERKAITTRKIPCRFYEEATNKAVKIDMPMPKNCAECRLCEYVEACRAGSDYYICVPNKKDLGLDYLKKRHPECPLKEIKNEM